MKTNHETKAKAGARKFTNACLGSCRRILGQIKKVKDSIFAESREALSSQEQLLRLTLNEAEALAFQTTYPHLVFPTLAGEKVQAIVAWKDHQQTVRHTRGHFA